MHTRMQAQAETLANPSFTPAHSALLQRKCACGGTPGLEGECTECCRKRLTLQRVAIDAVPPKMFQTKLLISQPGNRYEREADRVAEQVMRIPAPTRVQGRGRSCEEHDREVQYKPKNSCLIRQEAGDNSPTRTASPIIDRVINSGSGRPLDDCTRAFFEPRFGHDFSQVRVHADVRVAESARRVNTQAYTVDRDIVFGEGQFNPKTPRGQHLLAHELTHVVQQDAATKAPVVRQRASLDANAPSLDQGNRQVPTSQQSPLLISVPGASLQGILFRKMNSECGQDDSRLLSKINTHEWLIGLYFALKEPTIQQQFRFPEYSEYYKGGVKYYWIDFVVMNGKEAFLYDVKPKEAAEEGVRAVEFYIDLAEDNCDPDMDWKPGISFGTDKVVIPSPFTGNNIVAWQDEKYKGVILFETPKEDVEEKCGEDKNRLDTKTVLHESLIGYAFKAIEPAAQLQYKILTDKDPRWADIVVIKDDEVSIYEIKPNKKKDASEGKEQVSSYIKLAKKFCDGKLKWKPGESFGKLLIPAPGDKVIAAWQQEPYKGVVLYEERKKEDDDKEQPESVDKTKKVGPTLIDVDRDLYEVFKRIGLPLPYLPKGRTVLLTVPDALYQQILNNRLMQLKMSPMKIDPRGIPIIQFHLALAAPAAYISVPLIIAIGMYAAVATGFLVGTLIMEAAGTAAGGVAAAEAGTAAGTVSGSATIIQLARAGTIVAGGAANDNAVIQAFAKAAGIILAAGALNWGATEAQAQDVVSEGLKESVPLAPVDVTYSPTLMSSSLEIGKKLPIKGKPYRVIGVVQY